jgi:membrane protein YdbS with pleckstrin-like domain
MNAWWWVLIGLAAWFAVAAAVGLWVSPVLRRSSQAWEAPDEHTEELPAGTAIRLGMGGRLPSGI